MKDLQVTHRASARPHGTSPGPRGAHRGRVPWQAKYDALKKQMESMEMEVMEARLIRAAELNGELDDDDSGTVAQRAPKTSGAPRGAPPGVSPAAAPPGAPRTGGEWRLKYERAVREIDFTKKRLQQELEDKLEVEQQGKRQLERRVSGALPRDDPPLPNFLPPSCPPHGPEHPACPCAQLADLQADSEEGQRALQQLKKKCQRLASELQDTKLHLEGQQGRNHDLEKKQRRWGGAGTGTGWWHPPAGWLWEPLAAWFYHFSWDLGTSPAPAWARRFARGR